MPNKIDRPLTIKQRKFVKEYANLGNGTQAVLNSYNIKKRPNACIQANSLLRKPNIKKSLEAILSRDGLDLTSISNKVGSILHSEIKDIKAADSLRAADMLLKLHNAYPPSKSISTRLSITKRYEDMKYQDVIKELSTIRHKTDKLMNDDTSE